MPAPSPLAVTLLLSIFSAIVGAWIWVILRLAFGLPILPPDKARVVPWGPGSALAALLLWMVLNTIVPVVYIAATRPRPANPGGGKGAVVISRLELTPGEIMGLSAFENMVTIALIPLLLARTSGARLRDLGVVAKDADKQVARGVVAYPLLAPVVFGAMGLAILIWPKTNHPVEDAIVQDKSPGMVTILVLAGVVFAPMAEELIFRGVLLGWLTRIVLGSDRLPGQASMAEPGYEFLSASVASSVPADRDLPLLETLEIDSPELGPDLSPPETAEHSHLNPFAPPLASLAASPVAVEVAPRSRALPLLVANVTVSLVFATLHAAVWPTPIPLFFLSLGLGFLYQRTGGIIAPIALHMTFNGVSTLMMFLVLGGPAPAPKMAADPIPPPAVSSGLLQPRASMSSSDGASTGMPL